VRAGEDVSLRIIKIDPSRHRLGLSLRQAEEAGEYDYSGGGYEAWSEGTSYVLGGATATAEDNGSPPGEPQAEEQHEESSEPAANGTARVPEH